MKKICLLFLLISFGINYIKAQDFSVDPIVKDLGQLYPDDNIEFTITVTHYTDVSRAYLVSIYDHQNAAPWITSFSPESFGMTNYWQETEVTISGVFPTGWIGHGSFYLDVWDENNYKNSCLVKYQGMPSGGIEDWISFDSWISTFSEQDPLYYKTYFYDEDPLGDYIIEWNLNINLFSTQGDYEYVDITNPYGPDYSEWSFTAPDLPGDLSYIRNSLGQVYGVLTVTGIDNDGVHHIATMEIGIDKEPDQPSVYLNRESSNSIALHYSSTGGTNYLIYYDTDSGPPYNGTGLTQGDSPIDAGNLTTFQIDGVQECTQYYIAVRVCNDQGISDYSVEKQIMVFYVPNSLPVNYHFNDYYVVDDYTFDDNHYFIGNLVIQSGTTVTMNGGIIYFEEDSKVIIEPGGKLILNGTTLTAPCNQSWQGIEVWGNTNSHQFTINDECAQGKLIMNGATVENAYNAVTLWKPDDWNTRGGIIQANEANFYNNRRSVEFMSYQNYHPYTGEPMYYISHFTECEFDVNDEYIVSSDFAYHISMWEVKGINISACEFSNSMTNTGNTGYGIYTMDAGYCVRSSCTTNVSPCPEPDILHSTFTGFYAGIGALNSGSIYTFYVNDAVFDNNGYGIKLNASNYATLINNDFYVGDNNIDAVDCAFNFGVGVDLTNCNGYAVEENKFYESTTMTGNSIGVRVNYEEEYINNVLEVQNNEIYKNQYDGLYVGNEALGYNFNNNSQDGLQFLCNINQNNTYDFYIKDDGIKLYQGTLDEAAGNEFSLNGNNPFSDYNNQAVWPILYFYNESNTNEIPVDYSEKVFPNVAQSSNSCISHFGGGPHFQTDGLGLTDTQKITYEQQYSDNLTSYNGTLALYESLKDGGNTETVVIDIETSWPDEMWELRADLLANSPHLSKEVLYATADNTGVFPDAVIFEILAANPDEMRDEEFLTYLAEKENPLPDYYIDILRGLAGNISYKTILQSQMSSYKSKITEAAYIIIRNMLNDSICDMGNVRSWLENLNSLASDYQIIDSYLQEGNTSDALTLLGLIPSAYGLTGEDTIEYNRYSGLKQLQATLINQGRNIFMLSDTEKSILEEIADNSRGQAGTHARNILEFVYGNHYCDCPEIPDPVTHKNFTPSFYQQTNDLYKAEVDVFPNPAKTWTAFEYHLPYNNGDVYILIYNTQGHMVHTLHLSGLEGQAVWDVRDVKPGVYYYVLKSAGGTKSGNLIISN